MKQAKIILLLVIAFSHVKTYADNHVTAKQFINHKDWNFIENKGQLNTTQYPRPEHSGGTAPNTDIKYYGHQGGVYLYCKPGMVSFVFTKVDNGDVPEATGLPVETRHALSLQSRKQFHPSKITTSRLSSAIALATARADLVLLNSNTSAEILASDQQEYYENYYTANTPEEGITNVHTYKTITYRSIYPHIDFVLHSRECGMKYEFVVHPGGNVNDIQMQWKGLEGIIRRDAYGKRLKDSPSLLVQTSARAGGIEYSTALGKMTETAPYTYQDIGDNIGAGLAPALSATTKIKSRFVIKNNLIEFKTDKYNQSKTLVIDPTLVWATYFGGDGEDGAEGVTTDALGNVMIAGYTGSALDIASSGAYQTSYGGNGDAFIAKFSNTGKMTWSTYYGGSGNDRAFSIVTDRVNDIYIYGVTDSKTGIATSGAYQTTNTSMPALSNNLFIAKFSASGTREWGTYFGAGSILGLWGSYIATDDSGNIFITGYTISDTGIATLGTYQTSLMPGTAAAFIEKFSSLGNRIWGTYFGGNRATIGYGITLDRTGDIFITGSTSSDKGLASTGAFQTVFGGGDTSANGDVFVAKFNSMGGRLWSTYYGGNGDDHAYDVVTDYNGNAYITGATNSDTGIASPGAWQADNGHMFITKFSPNGNRVWGSYFGSKAGAEGRAIAIAPNGSVFIEGDASGDSGIATPGAYQQYSSGGGLFIERFSTSGSRLWGSFYNIKYGNVWDIAADAFNNVYITGGTYDSSLATTDAYQTIYAGNEDAYITKFNFTYRYDAGITGFLSPADTSCPGSQVVSATLKNFGKDSLDSVIVNWQVNGKAQSPYHWAGGLAPDSTQNIVLGNYNFALNSTDTVKAWTGSPDGFMDSVPENDTATLIVLVQRPKPLTGPPQNICAGTVIQLGAVHKPGRIYNWTSGPKGFSSSLSNPIDSPVVTTIYYLKETVSSTGCTDSDSVRITVVPRPDVVFDAQRTSGYTYQFTATEPNYPGNIYRWDFGDPLSGILDSASGYTVSHTYPQNGKYMAKLTVSLPGYCTVTDSYQVTVNETFSLNVFPNPFNIQTGINYILESPAHVRITMVDDIGRQIGTILDKQLSPGEYNTYFSGSSWKTRPGMYFIVFQVDDDVIVRKIIQIGSIYY